MKNSVYKKMGGGSWYNIQDHARANLRLDSHPFARLDSGGFRVLEELSSDRKTLRGGSWLNYLDAARSAYRSRSSPYYRFDVIGFRLLEIARDE